MKRIKIAGRIHESIEQVRDRMDEINTDPDHRRRDDMMEEWESLEYFLLKQGLEPATGDIV